MHKLTDEEKEIVQEFNDGIVDLDKKVLEFKENSGHRLLSIKDSLQKQEKQMIGLTEGIISFEKENKDLIDSLAIRSIINK